MSAFYQQLLKRANECCEIRRRNAYLFALIELYANDYYLKLSNNLSTYPLSLVRTICFVANFYPKSNQSNLFLWFFFRSLLRKKKLYFFLLHMCLSTLMFRLCKIQVLTNKFNQNVHKILIRDYHIRKKNLKSLWEKFKMILWQV